MKAIKVLLADDHTILRQGLRRLLESSGDVEIVGEAATGKDTIRLCLASCPDVLVLDISLPDLSGIDVTRQIRERLPDLPIVILTVHSSKEHIREAMLAGASGYILKDSPSEELLKAIHAATRGEAYLSPAVSRTMLDDYVCSVGRPRVYTGSLLSPREEQVLRLIVKGHRNKDVGDILNISVKTVESHKYRIMKKLGLRNIQELVLHAIREGYVKVPLEKQDEP